MLKIIHCLNHFLPTQIAGTEVYTWALSKTLQNLGAEVEVVIPNYESSVAFEYVFDEIKVFRYAEPSVIDRSLIMGKRVPDGLVNFEKHLQAVKPDIVHFHELAGSSGMSVPHVKAAKSVGAKVVMTFHLAGYSCRTGSLMFKDKELCNGLIDTYRCSQCFMHSKGSHAFNTSLWALSAGLYKLGINTSSWNNKIGTALSAPYLIDAHKKKFSELINTCDKLAVYALWYKKILLINNAPEEKIIYVQPGLPSFNPGENNQKSENSQGNIKLMFIGRISHFKGLDIILKALRELPQDKLSLDIYGDTNDQHYFTQCKNIAKNLTNVNWMGKLSREEVITFMQKYDALCLASTFSEMSPLVIQEAYAAGIPIIASNVYGNAEQIKDGINGYLFQFKSAPGLKKVLENILNNPEQFRMMHKNINTPREFEKVGLDYLNLYKTLV